MAARQCFAGGERSAEVLCALVRERLGPALIVDYVDIRDEDDFTLLAGNVAGGRIVTAIRLGATRLLDNLSLR